ncbi:MAG TPA: hypothetical protein VMV29_08560 [Ktedonobacterales bacterium]|nr:hypothetical protein [Ktedonobacterales bacterium]
MAPAIAVSDALRMADEEGTDTVLLAESYHGSRTLVAQIPYLPPLAGRHFAAGGLESTPAPGAFVAAFALLGKASNRHVMPTFQRTDSTSRDDQRRAGIGGHGSLVYLT